MILFHNSYTIQDSNKNVTFYVLNNICFSLYGKLIRSKSGLVCMRFRIRRYVEAPEITDRK